MDRLLGIGLAVGFLVSGVAAILITLSQQLGIALIIFGVILGFLFANPKSPVRKYWWSVSGKLGVVLITNIGVGDKYLTIHVGLRAVSVIQVDKIALKIGRKQLLSDWEPMEIQADEHRYINFPRPTWLRKEQYNACLIAYTPEGFSKSKKFSIKVGE